MYVLETRKLVRGDRVTAALRSGGWTSTISVLR
jgi:hypothetical protein